MQHLLALGAATLALALAAPAAAANYDFSFTGHTDVGSSFDFTSGDLTATLTAGRYAGIPSNLSNISNITNTPRNVVLTHTGVGVWGGLHNGEVDSNHHGAFGDALVVSFSKPTALTDLSFARIDATDSFRVFGVTSSGALQSLGIAGLVHTGGNDGDAVYNPFLGTARVTLDVATDLFSSYVFTNNILGGLITGEQSYQLAGLKSYIQDTAGPTNPVGGVPEPATWAMLIAGFGAIGVAARRRRIASAKA